MSNIVNQYVDNLQNQTNNQLGLYLFCCGISVIWAIYVLFFNSRIIGIIITFFINLYLKKYSKKVWIRIRSLSVSFLSGKIMFRGVHYVTVDYMMYIQDGWISFAYWKPQYVSEKSSNSNDIHKKKTARLNIFLCNLQLHYYNSWKLETDSNQKKKSTPSTSTRQTRFNLRNFSINNFIRLICNKDSTLDDSNDAELNNYTKRKSEPTDADSLDDHDITEDLMQLFSVVNIRIQKGRLFAGNMTLPSLFSVRLSYAKMELVTEKSQSKLDEYCFILSGELSKLEASLIPNKKHPSLDPYKGTSEKKSENRVLFFRSAQSDFKYIQDVPSVLKFDNRILIKSETGEFVQNEKEPQWSLVLNCNKQTTLNYGPWFDRQREHLWGFFFPQIFGTAEPDPEPTLNERRQTSKFDFTLNTKDPNTEINILFTKLSSSDHMAANLNGNNDSNKETNSKAKLLEESLKNASNERKLSIKCKEKSSIVCSFPWLTKHYGYKTTIDANLNAVECQTNLAFKHFLNAERAVLAADINYPLRWNDLQIWNINLDLFKSDIFFTFYHKFFFQQMINDWSSRSMGDLRKFVPYIYDFKLRAQDLEVILPCNQYNWLDCAILENNAFFEVLAHNASLDIKFIFDEYLPEKMNIPMDLKIHDACARFFVPPTDINLALLKILRKNMKYISVENNLQSEFNAKRWSRYNKLKPSDSDNTINNNPTSTSVNNNNKDLDNNKTEININEIDTNVDISNVQTNDEVVNTEAYLNNKEKPVVHSFKSSFTNKHSKPQMQPQRSRIDQFKSKKTPKDTDASKSNRKNQNNQVQNEPAFDFSENWFECWQANYASVIMSYEYHPCPVLDWNYKKLKTVNNLNNLNSPHHDCEKFPADLIALNIEIGPSIIMLYGTFLRRLWFIKEDFLSWDQTYTEIMSEPDASFIKSEQDNKSKRSVSKPWNDILFELESCDKSDPRNFRPLSVKVLLAIHNINAHLVMDLEDNVEHVPFPIGFTDRLALELEKNYNETVLQLYFDPVNLFLVDRLTRTFDKNICQGHLCLSSVQLRGHAMFSDEGRLKTDALEYAWLLEILLGDITGAINPIQTQQIVQGLETILTLVIEKENSLEPVFSNRIDPSLPYKYEVTRFSIDLIDVYMIESGTALNLNVHPVRLAVCNSHTKEYAKGLSACMKTVKLKLFINEASRAEDSTSKSTSSRKRHSSSRFNASRVSLRSSNSPSQCLLSSTSSVATSSSISISSLDSDSSLASMDSIKDTLKRKRADTNLSSRNNQIRRQARHPDSDEFNYWFECFSFSTGQINFDLALDKGDPIGQIEFLRIHDRKRKNLYFLWNPHEDLEHAHKYERIKVKGESTYKCGCFGGCHFYSVFDEKYSKRKRLYQEDEFFNLNKSITRGNENYALSYFVPDKKILDSHEIMITKYEPKMYTYQLSSMHPAVVDDLFSQDETSISSASSESVKSKPKSIRSVKHSSQVSLAKTTSRHQRHKSEIATSSMSHLKDLINDSGKMNQLPLGVLPNGKLARSVSSSSSLSTSSSGTVKNDDDFYTADEEEEEVIDETGSRIRVKVKYEKNPNSKNGILGKKRSLAKFSQKSVNSLKSKNSFVSVKDNDLKSLHSRTSKTPLTNPRLIGQSVSSTELRPDRLELNYLNTIASNLEEDDVVIVNEHNDHSSQVDTEMTLKFDIQRPILDSVLPKYFYLKYLSRAYVQNWNKPVQYPYYEDHKSKNINFEYRQKGFDCSYVKTRNFNPKETDTASSNKINQEQTDEDLAKAKCKINLKFTHDLELYITPLALTALERYIKSLKSYKTSANQLLTQLQSKSESYFASNSLSETLSQTQVCIHIPQIMLCSLQCGLAEGDKVSNAFSSTLACPEEFMTLSLFTICVHSVQTQLIDNLNKTAAIFMIDKIESQFNRLHENALLKKPIKLSCISDKHSKTLIRCFKENELLDENDRFKKIQNSIMYECAFERISIKAVKNSDELNTPPEQQPQQQINNKLSLIEFEISKIWFSFPEPPISPKGKRKIPYTRNDWNLLSSVSPAVSSWLCASKHATKPLKEYLDANSRHVISVMAALIAGALKDKENIEQQMEHLLHLNPMVKKEDLLLNKTRTKANAKQQQQMLKDLTYNKMRFKKMLRDFVCTYMTSNSFGLINDSNIILVNLMRNYLLMFSEEFHSDLASHHLPDEKYLKKAVSEVLTSWSTIIQNTLEEKTQPPQPKTSVSDRVFISVNENLIKEINEINQQQMQNQLNQNTSFSEDALSLDIELNQMNKENAMMRRENQTTSNDEELLEKTQSELREEEEKYKKASKLFRPVLSFIGIDAPTGKLIDNLFKELGSLLIGSLTIKSVDINILGKQMVPAKSNDMFNERFRASRKTTVSYSQFTEMEKVITTILSFDGLLINLSIRKIVNDSLLSVTINPVPVQVKSPPTNSKLSMVNPVYAINNQQQAPNNSKQVKYSAKIDANMKLNNLTQEVNMPLLRLVHQLYSIIADAIDYDKEQTKLIRNIQADDTLESNLNQMGTQQFGNHDGKTPTSLKAKKDCWKYIEKVLEPKFTKEDEINRQNSMKSNVKHVLRTRNFLVHDGMTVSLFAWMSIHRINSKATLGTLALNGEMKNVQLSATFGPKSGTTSTKKRYEASVNACVHSTNCRLTENENHQNVVQIRVAKCHLFGMLKKSQIKNNISSFVHIGKIDIDVPLRPMLIHTVVYRESKVIEQNILPEIKHLVIFENSELNTSMNDSAENNNNNNAKLNNLTSIPDGDQTLRAQQRLDTLNILNETTDTDAKAKKPKRPSFLGKKDKYNMLMSKNTRSKLTEFIFDLKSKFDGCEIRAKLLEKPCLKASYQMSNIFINALVSNDRSSIECSLASHCLSFQCDDSIDERTSFDLPSIDLKGSYFYNQTELFESKLSKKENSLTKKSVSLNTKEPKVYNSLYFKFRVSPLAHELNAEVIAQLVFVTKVFIKEINNILQAVYTFDNENDKQFIETNKESSFNKHLNTTSYFYYDLKVYIGKISLTGLTPTNTALTFYTGDNTELILTNMHGALNETDLFQSAEYSLRPFIESKCNISIELKTMHKKQNDETLAEAVDSSNDWFQLAFFNTKFDLKNENMIRQFHSELERESITITVEKPRFYLQPGAVDSAILFWLNYKSTYEYWLQQRQEFSSFLIDKQNSVNSKHSPVPCNLHNDHSSRDTIVSTVPQQQQDLNSNLLALKLRVTGLGLALPLSNSIKKDIFKTTTDCLVISLNDTSFYACNSVGCVVTKGQFSNFCLRFADNFNLTSDEWSPSFMSTEQVKSVNGAFQPQTKAPMNSWVVPSGSYEVCSSTIEKEKLINTISKMSPIWILSVKWKMEGIEVNFDTCIGKWLSKLAETVTRLAETQNNAENINQANKEYEIKMLKNELRRYKESGDTSKFNIIQSKLDAINLSSYPEKAKQMIIKTRNNLRDQLGFKQINNNGLSQKSSLAAKKMTIHNEVVSRNLLPSLISPSQKKTFIESKTGINSHRAGSQHSRSKSGDFVNFRRFSLSNDDFNLSYYNYKPNEFNDVKNSPINENDSDEVLYKIKNASLDNPNYEVYDDKASSPQPQQQPQQQQQQLAPATSAIDFKLEIKIEISSGKWILHASKLTNANEMTPDNFYFDYPNTHHQVGPSRSLFNRFDHSSDADMRNTNFIFPAIKVKAFYESSHKTIENRLSKKANLYALIRLDSLVMPTFAKEYPKKDLVSREMCISPALLDFLEQTLEPLDTLRSSLESASRITTPLNKLQKDQQSTLKSQKDYMKADVISEDPVAPEETPIKHNSSGEELTKESSPPRAVSAASEGAAYFPIEVVAFVSMQPSSIRFTCLPQSTMECVLKLPTLEMVFSTYKSIDSTLKENIYNDLNNGLHDNNSSTLNAKENDLNSTATSKSLVRGSEKGGLSVTCSMTDFSLKFYNRLAIIKHNNDPKDYRYEHSINSDEKDSLSVRVEFIRINISRSRKLSTKEAEDPFIRQHDITSSRLSFHQNIITYNDVELSVLADIGTSSFIYDMRNIKEVFIFPRIWYRRSLARRLFLGEESSSLPAYKSTTSTSNLNNNNNLNNSTGFLYKNDFQNESAVNLNEKGRPKSMVFSMEQENSYCVNSKWKTLVLIAVNLSDFEVKMNIGSVMGNVRLFAKNAKTKSRISISSFGKKSMLLNFVLENCRLIAEGGSNGCLFRIQDITSNVEINDKNNEKGSPSHKLDFGIAAAECRIDCAYNAATPILAFRLSSFTLKLSDSWDLLALDLNKLPEAILEINVVWDQLHLMITKATTPDLIKMFYKLVEFFEKQLNEGKDYIKDFDIFYDSKVKQQFTEKVEPALKRNFAVNGGNIQLKGNNLSLITFNGSNFRAKNWALFSLNEPSLEFACQTYIKNNENVIQENLVFDLGRNIKKNDMATIYKVFNESSHIFARCESISEWFEYAHGNIDAPGLRDFPRFRSDEIEKKIRKKTDPVNFEEIFRLPSLQIFCNSTQENRTVKFEFKTEFHDYILLTFRTELVVFLHELITSYVKEKDKDTYQIKEIYIAEAKVDNREYDCIRWDLNPQLRLMPKFGSSVDPPRVDMLLKTLGFNYARSTIPKWFQRGLLDSLNDVLFQLIKIYLKILSDQDLKLKTSTKKYDE